jgi:VWFA-related protein
MKTKAVLFTIVLMLAAALVVPSFSSAQDNKPKAGQQKKDQKPTEDDAAQDDTPIKIGTQLVTVPFNITDKTNRYINDLKKEDIEVLEDNKPQEIFSFERQTDLAITIAMLIDISGSESYTLPMEKAAGARFFQKVLRPRKDLGAVVTFEGEAELVQNLTSDPAKLERALDDVRISTAAAAASVGGTPPINGGSRAGTTAIWDAVYSVSNDLLRREAGRRVIILITDGVDTSSSLKLRDAIERTWRNEVIVYAIGIGDPGYDGVNSGVLKKITQETGGRAFFPRSEGDLDKAFAQIDEDLRSQYVLAYTPTNGNKDGSFRTIQLRVKNQKELTVRHRRGYFAPGAAKAS